MEKSKHDRYPKQGKKDDVPVVTETTDEVNRKI